MKPIGFSTGALAKGDFAVGLAVQRGVPRIDAVELSALRDHELPSLVDAIPNLDLDAFEYVSFHAPSKLQSLDERTIFKLLLALPDSCPIIVHPELLQTPALWQQLGERLCLENMDNRKTTGRTIAELLALFETFPEAKRSALISVTRVKSIPPWSRRCSCCRSSAIGCAADIRHEISRRQVPLLHHELDRFDRVGQIEREVPALVRLDQRDKHFQPIAFRRVAFRPHQ
jgi:hypothetical protein